MIPKEGSNTFSGSMFTGFAHPSWLMNNVNQDLIDRGIQGGEAGGVGLDQSWQVAPTIGGPIVQDKLWFFLSYSYRRGSLFPAQQFNSEDTGALSYVPDLDVPTRDRSDIYEGSVRLTWQASSKDKVQAYWSNNHTSQIPSLTGSQLDPLFIAPEAGSDLVTSPNNYQVKWTRPQTNRILFEAAFGMQPSHNLLVDLSETGVHGNCRGDCGAFDTRSDLPSAFEFATLTMSRNMGFFFGGTDRHFQTTNYMTRASMSYVTGTHNLKFGFSANDKSQTESSTSQNDWTNMATFLGLPVNAYFENIPPRDQRFAQYRDLRTGPVDARSLDGERRTAVRLLQRELPRPQQPSVDLAAPGAVLPWPNGGDLERPPTPARRRVRSAWRWANSPHGDRVAIREP